MKKLNKRILTIVGLFLLVTLVSEFPIPLVHAGTTYSNQGFDMGSGPLYDSFIAVGGSVYSDAVGYGWNTAVATYDRGPQGLGTYDNLWRDFCYLGSLAEFKIHLDQTGDYNVTIWVGDVGWGMDVNTSVNSVEFYHFFVAAPCWLVYSSIVTTSSLWLNISVYNTPANIDSDDGNWRINGIQIAYIPPTNYVYATFAHSDPATLMVNGTDYGNETVQYLENDTLFLVLSVPGNYTFLNWTYDGGSDTSNPFTYIITENVTITAYIGLGTGETVTQYRWHPLVYVSIGFTIICVCIGLGYEKKKKS